MLGAGAARLAAAACDADGASEIKIADSKPKSPKVRVQADAREERRQGRQCAKRVAGS